MNQTPVTTYVVLNIWGDVEYTIELITTNEDEADAKLAEVKKDILEAEGHDDMGDTLEEAWESHLQGDYDGYATILTYE